MLHHEKKVKADAKLRARAHSEMAHLQLVAACADACAARVIEAQPPPPPGGVYLYGETANGLRVASMGHLIQAGQHYQSASKLQPLDKELRDNMEHTTRQRKLDPWEVPSVVELFAMGGCDVFAGRKLDPKSSACPWKKRKRKT